MMLIQRVCPVTGKRNIMNLPVTHEQLHAWQHENLPIEEAMPQLTDDQRNFIETGHLPQENTTTTED